MTASTPRIRFNFIGGLRRRNRTSLLIVALRHGLEPVGCGVDVHRDVRAPRARGGAVPVLLAGVNDDGVTCAYLQRRLAPFLHTHAPLDDEQPLGAGVRVPVRPPTLLELHPINVRRHADIVRRQTLRARRTSKRVDVCSGEGSGVSPKHLHSTIESPVPTPLLSSTTYLN